MNAYMQRWLVNGREDGAIRPDDRGLAYGDGLFETIAVREGRPRLLERHLARLAEGCTRLGIPMPPTAALHDDIAAVSAGAHRGTVKLIVTRGAGLRGYAPPASVQPVRAVGFSTSDGPGDGHAELVLCSTPAGINPALAGLKTLNRLENVLARAELQRTGATEGVMCDCEGRVTGATMANLFLVRRGTLLTPRLDCGGIRGVMRSVVLELASAAGMVAIETDLRAAELAEAEEMFLTNALIGIWPVGRFAGRELACGPVSRKMIALLASRGIEERAS